MSSIDNTIELTAGIAPIDSTDTFPTHYSEYGKGGFYAVDNYAALANISTDRLGNGEPLILLRDTKQLYYYYESAWVELVLGGGGDCCTVVGTELDGDQVIQINCEPPVGGNNWFFDNTNVLNNTQLTGSGDLVV